MNVGKVARDLARHKRLKIGKPKKLPHVEIDGLRDELKNIFTRSFPGMSYEAEFMTQTAFGPDALAEGFIERRDGGIEVVLNRVTAGHRLARVVLRLPYEGDPPLSSELQVSRTSPGIDIVCGCSWPMTCNV